MCVFKIRIECWNVKVTDYVALALPCTLTLIRGIHMPRYSNAAWVLRPPGPPAVPGPP